MKAKKKAAKPASKKKRLPAVKSETKKPPLPEYHYSGETSSGGFLGELEHAMKLRRYDEVERIATELLDSSPSEEVDRFLNDIITSATTVRDAEDEIRYQLDDLRSALEHTPPVEGEVHEVDGL